MAVLWANSTNLSTPQAVDPGVTGPGRGPLLRPCGVKMGFGMYARDAELSGSLFLEAPNSEHCLLLKLVFLGGLSTPVVI